MSATHVACAVAGDYWLHSAAMLGSVAQHVDRGTLHVHYLHGPDLPGRARDGLARMLHRLDAEADFQLIEPGRVAGLPVVGEFTAAMWYRIFLPDLLPEVERVLYLDIDTLVTADLTPLLNTDLEGCYLGAVTNVLMPHHRHRPALFGLTPNDYFNSGVLLMNLAALRADDCTRSLREFAVAGGTELEWPDQDALNVVLGSRRRHLHPRWNVMNSLRFDWAREVFTTEEIAEARARPGIRHFEGPDDNKPWHWNGADADQRLYRRHRRRTPWPRYRPDGSPALPRRVARRVRRALRP
jgi:lipopolysaccharide biosynthesis glycosyltransferase